MTLRFILFVLFICAIGWIAELTTASAAQAGVTQAYRDSDTARHLPIVDRGVEQPRSGAASEADIAQTALRYSLDCSGCGDANSDAVLNISDAVFLYYYIFEHGTAPGDCNYAFGKGDANGDGVVNVSDIVYLCVYIFRGGPAPHCCQNITDCPPSIHQDQGNADVTIRINGALPNGTIQMIPGQDNILEFWITNSAKIIGMSLGFELSNGGQPYSLVKPYGTVPYADDEGNPPIQDYSVCMLKEHGTTYNFLNTFGGYGNLRFDTSLARRDTIFFGGVTLSPSQTKDIPVHLTSTLAYSVMIRIPAGQAPGSFCVRPIFVPPAGA